MNLLNIFKSVLSEEKLPEGKKGILLLDIDDTLLKADGSLIKIYRKLPTDKEEVALTSAEYAKENVTPETRGYYDYRDFDNGKKVYASIAKGAPLLNNLKVVDAFYNGGYKLGILTARGCANDVKRAIKAFLKVRDVKGNFVDAPIDEKDIHCVNDAALNKAGAYPGATDFEKKQNVLRNYAKKYDYVYFIDDDPKNINALKALKKADPEIAEKLRSIDAKKNMLKPLKEEILSEMAAKDVTSEILNAIKAKDYGKALVLYFNIVKNQPAYAGKKDTKSAFKHMLTFGIARTFSALEKKGQVPEGSTQEMKMFGIQNVDKLIDGIEYEGNPDYVAKKRNITTERKKVAAKTVETLLKGIEKYEAEGWTIKDKTPKVGSTKTIPSFYYVYATRPKQIFDEEVEDSVILEMAMKDVDSELLSNIKNKNYKDALIKYFNNIKGQSTYAKFDTVGKAYDQMRRYGLARTFNAFEKNGSIPAGASKELKAFADNAKNRAEILAALGGEDASPTGEAKKATSAPAEKKAEAPKLEGDAGALKKIKDRVEKYGKIRAEIDDYITTGKFVTPFAVDIRRNGESGVPLVEKPLVAGIAKDNPNLTKSERYMVPMKEFRSKFIPSFIEKEAMKDLTSEQKRNLDKAETLGAEHYEATKNKILGAYMSNFLNNIVMGLSDFNKAHSGESLTDKQILDELKTEVDFPYNDFVKLEKWFKETKIARDKLRSAKREKTTSSAAVPKEVEKLKSEYISYLNALNKAIAEDKAGEFLSAPDNLDIACTVLDSANKPIDSKKMQAFKGKNAAVPNDKLAPALKKMYQDRFDETGDADFAGKYDLLRSSLRKAIERRNELVAKGEEIDWKIDANIETLAKKVIEATMDRLIAVELLERSANSGVFKELAAAAEKHRIIKEKYAKLHPEEAKKADANKYDEYYTPEEKPAAQETKPAAPEEKTPEISPVEKMYKAVQASIDKLAIPDMLKRRLQVPKTINLPNKKYTDEEIKELYDALQKGDEELYKLIAEPKFRDRRS